MIRFEKPLAAPLAALTLLFLSLGHAGADTLAGPSSFPIIGGNDTRWGIQFTALTNATLTSFDYNHRDNNFGDNGLFGTISLKDLTAATTIYTSPYGTNQPAVISFTGLNLALNSGDVYQLVATSNVQFGANDEVYQYGILNSPPFAYPVSDSQISVTQGVFDNNPGFQEANAWGAFTHITTTSAAVPEPGAYASLGSLGLIGAAFLRRKRAR